MLATGPGHIGLSTGPGHIGLKTCTYLFTIHFDVSLIPLRDPLKDPYIHISLRLFGFI